MATKYEKTLKVTHLYITITATESNHFIVIYYMQNGKVKVHCMLSAGSVIRESGSNRINAKTKTSPHTQKLMYDAAEKVLKQIQAPSATLKIKGVDGSGRTQAIRGSEQFNKYVPITEIIYAHDAATGGCRPKKRRRV